MQTTATPYPTPWQSTLDLRAQTATSARPDKIEDNVESEDSERIESESKGGIFAGLSIPVIVPKFTIPKKSDEQRLSEEAKIIAEAEQREKEMRHKLLQEREKRLALELEEEYRRLEADRREREAAELESRLRREREQRELEKRLRRQRQEEWERRLDDIRQGIKKQQIRWMWNRWHSAYMDKKEQQRKIEAVLYNFN